MTMQILVTDWDTHAAALMAIREQVFIDEQGVPRELEHDAYDLTALHLLALIDQAIPVGTARLLEDGHIGRMAVIRAWRGQGIGSALLRELVAVATGRGQSEPFLHAQCAAIPFYERYGFRAEGPVFMDAGIAHRLMRYTARARSG
jgi:predicted GNAT family N-acyltransferase